MATNQRQATREVDKAKSLVSGMEQDKLFAGMHVQFDPDELRQDEKIYSQNTNAKQLFNKTAIWLKFIKENSRSSGSNIIAKELQETLIRTIHGSNRIEHAGLGWEATQYYCRQVLEKKENVIWIYESHEEAVKEETLAQIQKLEPDVEGQQRNIVLRARNEIVQHAKAYHHILDHFITREEDISEELIKETHRILTMGVPLEDEGDGVPEGTFINDEYGGIYRNVIVTAGTTCFAHPKGIPALMTRLCQSLKSDIEKAKQDKKLDPFSLAARYSMEFVQIHPFRDGNGRMCRIILNAILCRFAGVFCPIGEDDEDVKTYIGIKRREGESLHGHGEYADFVLRKCYTRTREMKKKLSGRTSEKGTNN